MRRFKRTGLVEGISGQCSVFSVQRSVFSDQCSVGARRAAVQEEVQEVVQEEVQEDRVEGRHQWSVLSVQCSVIRGQCLLFIMHGSLCSVECSKLRRRRLRKRFSRRRFRV